MIHRLIRRAGSLVRQTLVKLLPGMGEQIMQLATYYPHAHIAYSVPVYRDQVIQVDGEPLPVPPQHPFWGNYCTSAKSWVQSGKDDTETMRRILRESGFAIEEAGKILEWGVAGGRLIRHLHNLTPKTEIWGVDFWASAIRWCHEHLSPTWRSFRSGMGLQMLKCAAEGYKSRLLLSLRYLPSSNSWLLLVHKIHARFWHFSDSARCPT